MKLVDWALPLKTSLVWLGNWNVLVPLCHLTGSN